MKASVALTCLASLSLALSSALPPLVPAVHSFTSSPEADFKLPNKVRIVVDSLQASSRKDNGLTLIPPTLTDFSNNFFSDFKEIFPNVSISIVSLPVGPSLKPANGDIILTILPDDAASAFTLAKGVPTTEGYQMKVTSTSIVISGAGAKGVFWGTRTLLQGLVLTKGTFPSGLVKDQPDWQTRGFMLDVARKWYPINILEEICAYASWWKMSEFHVHLSDNLFPSSAIPASQIYARFRLRSDQFPQLTPHLNETYSRQDFENFQQQCAKRGVTVIPEFDNPGHSAVFTQWKPEIALASDGTLLNLSHPETIPTLEAVWQEFLPWIHGKQISIGADEYDSSLANDYNNFVNTMSNFIFEESGKTIRIWGTKEPSNTTSVSKNITIQHWDFSDDDPFTLIRQGYNVINSDDAFQYIVVKTGGFPSMLNTTRLWNGANDATGGIWYPAIFDRGNASNNPSLNEPRLQGSIMAAWNDPGPTASTPLEIFYEIKEGLPIVLSANWQAASRPMHLTEDQFDVGFPILQRAAPGQNMNRIVPSKSSLIIEYDLTKFASGSSVRVPDGSGNGYDGTLNNGIITTPLTSKGHNFTMLIEITGESQPGTLLSGPDDSFGFQKTAVGLTLAFTSTNITYPLQNFTLPSGSQTIPVKIVITATEKGTSAFVNGQHVGDFMVSINQQLAPMAFVAPLQNIGMAGTTLQKFAVWDGLQDVSKISSFM